MIDDLIMMNEDLPKSSSSAFDFCFAGGAKSDMGATAKWKMKIKQIKIKWIWMKWIKGGGDLGKISLETHFDLSDHEISANQWHKYDFCSVVAPPIQLLV